MGAGTNVLGPMSVGSIKDYWIINTGSSPIELAIENLLRNWSDNSDGTGIYPKRSIIRDVM